MRLKCFYPAFLILFTVSLFSFTPPQVPLKIEELDIPTENMSFEIRRQLNSAMIKSRTLAPFWRAKIAASKTPAEKLENQKELLSALILNAKTAFWLEIYPEAKENIEEAIAICRSLGWLEQADILSIGHLNRINEKAFEINEKNKVLDQFFNKKAKLPLVDYLSFTKNYPFHFFIQGGHSSPIRSMAVDPTGSYLFYGGEDKTLFVYDLQKKAVTQKIFTEGAVKAIAVAPNGKSVCWIESRDSLMPDGKERLKIWNLKTNEIFVKEERNLYVDKIVIDSLGKHVYAAGFLLRVFDLQNGNEIKKLNFSKPYYSLAVTPDMNYLFLGFYQGIDCLSLNDFRIDMTFRGHQETVGALAVSPDGKMLVSGSGQQEIGKENEIKVWDIKEGRLLKTLSGHSNTILNLSLTPGGEAAVSSSYDQTVKFWNLQEGKLIKSVKVQSGSIHSLILEPKNNSLITCDSKDRIKMWNHRGQTELEINPALNSKEEFPDLVSFAFAPGNRVILNYSDGKTHVWNLNTAGLEKTYSFHLGGASRIIFDFFSGSVFSLGEDLKIWDIETGEIKQSLLPGNELPGAFANSAKGNYFALAGALKAGEKTPGKVFVYEKNTGRQVVYMVGFPTGVKELALDETGKYLAVGEGVFNKMESNFKIHKVGGNISVYELPSGKMLAQANPGEEIERIEFEPDRKSIVAYLKGNQAKKLDIESGMQNTVLYKKHPAAIESQDGRYSLARSFQNSVQLTDRKTNEVFSLLNIKDQWMITTPRGYFDATEGMLDMIGVSQGFQSGSLKGMLLKYNRPDKLIESLGIERNEAVSYFNGIYKKRLSLLSYIESQLNGMSEPGVKLKNIRQDGKWAIFDIIMEEKKSFLKTYQIYMNGVPLYGLSGRPIAGKTAVRSEKVELSKGQNTIEVMCFNSTGGFSSKENLQLNYYAPDKGSIYFIGIGVSEYQDSKLNLKYPEKDVRDLSELFLKMNEKGHEVFVKTLVNKEVRLQNFSTLRNFLKRASVDDTVIVFVSGNSFQGSLLTWASQIKNPYSITIPLDLIEKLLQGTKSRNRLLLLDLKNKAGIKVFQDFPYLVKNKSLILKDFYNRQGAFVFSSSRPGDVLYESSLVSNGFFALEIMNALKNKNADRNKDGWLSFDELCGWVEKNVAEHSGNLQHPTAENENRFIRFHVPMAK